MNILWCGGEAMDFVTGPPVRETWSPSWRADWARFSIMPPGSNFVCRGTPFWDGAVTSCWASCRLYNGSSNTDMLLIGLGQGSTLPNDIFSGVWLMAGDTNDNLLTLVKYSPGRVILATEASPTFAQTYLHHVVMQVINYGASATVNCYLNGNLRITYNGDISCPAVSALDTMMFAGRDGYQRYSELMVSDSDPHTLNLKTLGPAGAGDTSDWTGAYTDIDDYTEDYSDCVYVNEGGKDMQFAMSNMPAGDYHVWGLKVAARGASPFGSLANNISLGVKSGGTVDADDGRLLSESWTTKERWMTKINGSAITPAMVDALQMNLRSKEVLVPGSVAAQAAVENVAVTAV